jgi:hypothetical protein
MLYAWSINIEVTGYKPVLCTTTHSYSGSAIAGAENFSNTTLSGYSSKAGLTIWARVLYIKN